MGLATGEVAALPPPAPPPPTRPPAPPPPAPQPAPPPAPPPDTALAPPFAAGPIPAVTWPHDLVSLYRARYADMVRVAFLLTGSGAEAEEIVQDAFVRVRHRIERVDNPSAYLRAAVVNGCRNRYRRILVERRHQPPLEAATHDRVDELGDALAGLPIR